MAGRSSFFLINVSHNSLSIVSPPSPDDDSPPPSPSRRHFYSPDDDAPFPALSLFPPTTTSFLLPRRLRRPVGRPFSSLVVVVGRPCLPPSHPSSPSSVDPHRSRSLDRPSSPIIVAVGQCSLLLPKTTISLPSRVTHSPPRTWGAAAGARTLKSVTPSLSLIKMTATDPGEGFTCLLEYFGVPNQMQNKYRPP